MNAFDDLVIDDGCFSYWELIGQSKCYDWTPVITFATPGNLNVVYASQIGRFVKIGNLAKLYFTLQTSTFTHTTASGALLISGIPFIGANIAGAVWVGNVIWEGINAAGYTQVAPVITTAGTTLQFNASGAGVAAIGVQASDMPSGGTVLLRGGIEYES